MGGKKLSLIYEIHTYLSNQYTKKNKSIFFTDYERQRKLLDSFLEPISLTERSYFQYKCQMMGVPFSLKATQNLGAIFLLIYYLFKPYKKPDVYNKNEKINIAVFLREGVTTDIIPTSLKDEYYKIYENPLKGNMFLSKDDKKFIWNNYILKYWYSPFFCTKCIVKLAIYSNVNYIYKPKAIITHNEYSYTSSSLTQFCHVYDVEHINVMHGEKLFNIRDSFVQFDRYYVWDQHYVNLLVELRASKEQFIIEAPDCVRLNIGDQNEYKYEYTYYLGAENEKELLTIKKNLLNTKVPMERICIRLHPRYCDEEQINLIFNGFQIEKPNEESLNISISQTKYVVSLYSTVLYQAYESGKNIVIDDVADPEKYEQLKNLKYIMMSKPHLLLSNVIGRNSL